MGKHAHFNHNASKNHLMTKVLKDMWKWVAL